MLNVKRDLREIKQEDIILSNDRCDLNGDITKIGGITRRNLKMRGSRNARAACLRIFFFFSL